jgi:sterol desaturase/sphingolipid hydroxylase (fatty acid hydroxylase superfamily)
MKGSRTESSRITARRVPTWVSGLALVATFGVLYLLERRRPLRGRVEPEARHTTRNLAVAGLAALTVRLAEEPVTRRLTRWVEARRFGLVKRLNLPAWLEVPLAILLLDYTLYLWHVLTHKNPWLWRVHQPHHADLDMDASTAIRFHFGEMLASVPWRAGQIVVIGAGPLALTLWQSLVLVEILFHHSNVELPPETERWLSRLIVTPRMHAIHHSVVEEETDSNWSNLLTVWDRLHGTLRLDVPSREVVIGVPAYREPAELELPEVLDMPFAPQRPSWTFADGTRAWRPRVLPDAETAERLPNDGPPTRKNGTRLEPPGRVGD